ncbi:MAG: hypothetical protein JXA10_08050, partial [Anaerolineae bacterium]|nr:hypothetical protein [Anaerolineae bacterium]
MCPLRADTLVGPYKKPPAYFRYAVLISFVSLIITLSSYTHPAHAQSPDDWTLPYRPAMLPAYSSELAAFSTVPRYTIHLSLDVTPETATIAGHQNVIYTNQTSTPLTEIVFRLYPNLNSYGGDMTVSSVTVNGTALIPQLDATRSILTVPLA